ncbi:hypothetical protein LXL04_023269 [Taraxacum kok-saghyz]
MLKSSKAQGITHSYYQMMLNFRFQQKTLQNPTHLSPRLLVNDGVRKVIDGCEERRHVPTSNNQMRVRPPPLGNNNLGVIPNDLLQGRKPPPPKQKINPPSVSRSNGPNHNQNHNQEPQVPSRPLSAKR